MREHFSIYESAYSDDIFWVQVSSIFKTADQEEEDIFPHSRHLNPIDIAALTNKKTPHILKHINENQPENLHKRSHTILKIRQLLPNTAVIVVFNPNLLKLWFIRSRYGELPVELDDRCVDNTDLVPDDIIVDVLV